MALTADSIFIPPKDYSDNVLRWAERMPGVTYKTRVKQNLDGDANYLSIEAHSPDFSGFVDKITHDVEGKLKNPGYLGDPDNLWAYADGQLKPEDRYFGLEPREYPSVLGPNDPPPFHKSPITPPATVSRSYELKKGTNPLEPPQVAHKAYSSLDAQIEDGFEERKAEHDEVMKRVSGKPAYEPLKHGVWVNVADNEDDVVVVKDGELTVETRLSEDAQHDEAKKEIVSKLLDLADLIKAL